MEPPETVQRGPNALTLRWRLPPAEASRWSRLQICDPFQQWRTVYWGPKCHANVAQLAPSTCYRFRLKGDSSAQWLHFRAATEPFSPHGAALHMTRAVKLAKSALIRKIALHSPRLLNVQNKEHKTPIVQALEAGDLTVVQLLVTLGADVNQPQLFSGRTPLMVALYRGVLPAAQFLIDKGARIDSLDINGLSLLHHAVDSGQVDSVQFALDAGADLNLPDCSGWTPLIRAAIHGHAYIAALLLSRGAERGLRDAHGLDYDRHRQLSSTPCWRTMAETDKKLRKSTCL